MTEPFSHEDRIEAGEAVIRVFDILEYEDIQQALIDVRKAVEHARDLYREHGLNDYDAARALVGTALGPLLMGYEVTP